MCRHQYCLILIWWCSGRAVNEAEKQWGEGHGLQPLVSQNATYKAHWNHLDKLNEKNCHVSQQKLGDKTSISHKHLEATIAELGY